MIENYSHIISTFQKEGKWYLRIERLLPDGSTNWLNDRELPKVSEGKLWDDFEGFMEAVGKDVGIDSPGVRRHFGIDEE